jgi:photosystem II reaction center protein PsbP
MRRHGIAAQLRVLLAFALVALTLVDLRTCDTFAAEPSTGTVPTKTYKSEQFGFSFDYPASWSVQQGSPSDRSQLLSLKLLSRDQNVDVMRDYSPGSFAIEVFANPGQLEVRDWLDEHGWPFGESGRSVTATSIGGLPALEVATGKMLAPNRFIYVAAHDVIVRLAPLAAQSPAILRSFRFEPER